MSMPEKINIRPFREADWESVWRIIEPVLRAGETFPQSPQMTEPEAHQYWTKMPVATYVAESEGEIVGTYHLRPNQPPLGAHVCNGGYIVGADFCGRGVGFKMGEHSLGEAVKLGFRAMQYNLVVKTNVASFKLWKKLGFETIGCVSEAFKHSKCGYVDAYIMYKKL